MNKEKAVYRELGIRAVIRRLKKGEDISGFHHMTIKAAKKREDNQK